MHGVYASGTTIYAATKNGLSISIDNGTSFVNYTQSSGLGSEVIYKVYANGNVVYAATYLGLSISVDGGVSWFNYTNNTNGLVDNLVYGLYVSDITAYAATAAGGLSICTVTLPL